jgi:hypothetical protein
MINLLNLFKKKSEPTKSDLRKPSDYYDINGKRWVIAESMNIKVQASAEDVQIYGWTLEIRWKKNNDEWYQWMTYWNNRIYQTRQSALDAAIKVKSNNNEYECRVAPLYKMNDPEWRDYQIDKLLTNPIIKEEIESKYWKFKEDFEIPTYGTYSTKFKKGDIITEVRKGVFYKLATFTDPGCLKYLKMDLLTEKIEEFNILEEKWIHPHLTKELKLKITKNKE